MGPIQNQPQPKDSNDAAEARTEAGRITSTDLLQGRQQVEIEHGGELYRLRVTKAGKLILTK